MRVCMLAMAALVVCAGCEKTGTVQRPAESLANGEDPKPSASRPAPSRALGPHFFIDCFDVYAECKAARGLPSVSTDGGQVAIADTGPKSARDEFVISLRILDAKTNELVEAVPIMTLEDRADGVHPDTGEPTDALRREIEERLERAETILARGRFLPLSYLGRVHEQQSSDVVGGVRATFDGEVLTIEKGDKVHWRRAIEPSPVSDAASGDSALDDQQRCGSYPVAEIHVWVHHSSGIALARVSYTTSHGCDVAPRYIAWR